MAYVGATHQFAPTTTTDHLFIHKGASDSELQRVEVKPEERATPPQTSLDKLGTGFAEFILSTAEGLWEW